ncbi:MAG: hypothetical protein IMZ70_05850 [Candidatus Atribacteria bacterium]|nr:hypothetical protein [Candidatus Atribacteria bacterium]
MKFKVGDKVKILPPAPGSSRHSTGVVCQTHTDRVMYPIRVRFDNPMIDSEECPYSECELELVLKIGEQLLFPFMCEVLK